ncbi:MAG: ribosome maturation factor RimM [Clostridia bacterium]
MKKYLEAGRLCAPRGIKGELKLDCWCDNSEFLCGVKFLYLDADGKKPLEVILYRPNIPSVTFKGFETREIASSLTNRTVFFDRAEIKLPDGVCYNDDLIGLEVFLQNTNEKIGVLRSIEDGVRNDFYIVANEDICYRIPDVDEYILKKSLTDGIFLSSVQGLEIDAKT